MVTRPLGFGNAGVEDGHPWKDGTPLSLVWDRTFPIYELAAIGLDLMTYTVREQLKVKAE